MLVNLVFAVVVLADDFGEREGSAVILVDAAEEVVAACNSGDFDTASAQECCRMFLRVSPPTTRHLRNQKRWSALRCDRWRAALGSARTRNNDAAALEDAPVAWVKDAAACSKRPHSLYCSPTGFKLSGVPAAPLHPCAMLKAKGVHSILFAGDSFVRHAYQSTLMLLSGNYKDGGIKCRKKKCPRQCQYAGQLKEKSCRTLVPNQASVCGQGVHGILLSLKYGGVAIPTESEVRNNDYVVWVSHSAQAMQEQQGGNFSCSHILYPPTHTCPMPLHHRAWATTL